jgi:hypothetical protein
MQAPASTNSFRDTLPPSAAYSLSSVQLNWQDATTAIFHAKLNGPPGSAVWARAWLSTEAGTLAESASPQLTAGDDVTLHVTLHTPKTPQNAYMRIESSPLHTEHVVSLKLAL